MKNTVRDEGPYNVTLWRVDSATGEVISCQAGRYVDGLILRAGGKWSVFSGKPDFHGEIVGELSSFAGRPCTVVVAEGTQGVKDGLRMPFKSAFQRAKILAMFSKVSNA